MKHLLIFLFAASMMTLSPPAHAQDNAQVYVIGAKYDTAFGNATKSQTWPVASQGGVTIQYALDPGVDTTIGYVSLWASVDGIDYAPLPGADSVAVSAATRVRKMWFIGSATFQQKVNPVRYIQVRTRFVSNTTNATSKAYIRTRGYRYP